MSVNAKQNGEPNALKGLVAGSLAGLVASAVMNEFQGLWSKLAEGEKRSHGAQSRQRGGPDSGIGRQLQELGKDNPDDTAPMRVANAVAVGLSNRELTPSEKETSGTALHYAFGISTGALYGVGAEFMPMITAGWGVPFGISVWLGADEGVVPALGLSKSPKEYPLSVHAYSLASHAVYGLTTELVRRAIRRAL
jgi:putative membrane protein